MTGLKFRICYKRILVCDEGDKSLLLAPLANRIQLVSVGRPRLAEIFCDMCIEISDTKPKIVVK